MDRWRDLQRAQRMGWRNLGHLSAPKGDAQLNEPMPTCLLIRSSIIK
jgi:hypothetical protein